MTKITRQRQRPDHPERSRLAEGWRRRGGGAVSAARSRDDRERGASSVELVAFTPLLMFAIFVVVQLALTWYGNELAGAVAREAARVVRTGEGTPESVQQARDRAVEFADQIGDGSLTDLTVVITRPDDTDRARRRDRPSGGDRAGHGAGGLGHGAGSGRGIPARPVNKDERQAGVRSSDAERGSMAVEIVLLTPLLVMMMFLVVAFGRYVSAEGAAQALARDAVRSATLERNGEAALAAARSMAAAAEPANLSCAPAELHGAFVKGGQVTVDVECTVSFRDLGLIGLPGEADVTASSTAPLDEYRRTGGGP